MNYGSENRTLTVIKTIVKHGKYSGTSVYVFNPFQILGLIPNRTYTKRIFPIRNKGKMINPFP
jgi:hypothetical protein